jgi:predicted ester cyclase
MPEDGSSQAKGDFEMSSESNKAVVKRFNDAFDRGDWATMKACVAPDVVATATGAPGPMDFDGFVGMGKVFLDAFSQSRHVVADQVAEGDVVATRGTWSAVHTGTFNGIAATNRPVRIDIAIFDHIKDGKIVAHHGALDVMGLMAQIGAMQAAA